MQLPKFLLPLLALVPFVGCASPHLFPRTKPLFAGLDESRVPRSRQAALAHAKTDFALARSGKEPRFAQYSGTASSSASKTYEGNGYRLTLVREWNGYPRRFGPSIEFDKSITGGAPFSYDELDLLEN